MPKYGPRSQADFRARHSSRFAGQEDGPLSVRNPRFRCAFFHSAGFCCHPRALAGYAASRPLLPHRTCQPHPMPIATTTLPLGRQPSPPRRPQPFFRFPFPPTSSKARFSFVTSTTESANRITAATFAFDPSSALSLQRCVAVHRLSRSVTRQPAATARDLGVQFGCGSLGLGGQMQTCRHALSPACAFCLGTRLRFSTPFRRPRTHLPVAWRECLQ